MNKEENAISVNQELGTTRSHWMLNTLLRLKKKLRSRADTGCLIRAGKMTPAYSFLRASLVLLAFGLARFRAPLFCPFKTFVSVQ
jgi:hypothetical protein